MLRGLAPIRCLFICKSRLGLGTASSHHLNGPGMFPAMIDFGHTVLLLADHSSVTVQSILSIPNTCGELARIVRTDNKSIWFLRKLYLISTIYTAHRFSKAAVLTTNTGIEYYYYGRSGRTFTDPPAVDGVAILPVLVGTKEPLK